MSDQFPTSSAERRAARDAIRKGAKVRRRAVEQAMIACWADEDADEYNWLDEAMRAHPGPEAAVFFLYGFARDVVERLAEATGEEQERVLKSVLAQRP